MNSYLSRCRPQRMSAFGVPRGEAMSRPDTIARASVWEGVTQSHTIQQTCQAPGSSPDSKVSTVQNDAVKMNVVELA
jgi:hypothetical protein